MSPIGDVVPAAMHVGRAATSFIGANMPSAQALLPSAEAVRSGATAVLPSVKTCGEILGGGVSHAAQSAADVVKYHPYAAAAVGTGLLVAAAPAVIAAPALAVAGFGTEGIVLSSAAASVHGMIGNVAAGSLFATLQSAGMGGAAAAAAVEGAVAGAGGAVAAGGALGGVASWWKGKA